MANILTRVCWPFFLNIFGGSYMQYKQNVHILLPAEKFEELRQLGHKLNFSRSKLVREAINLLLKKYRKKDNCKMGSNCDE